jgi:hypothetical protein
MKLNELISVLRAHPEALPRLILPDGDHIPAHFHITEVGHVAKRFIDCGGTVHDTINTCLLQTWHSNSDLEHRLNAATFAKILDLGRQVLPHDDLDVEVEYEDCAMTQFPIAGAVFADGRIDIQLGEKHTDCLAKERCGIDGQSCGTSEKTANGVPATCC